MSRSRHTRFSRTRHLSVLHGILACLLLSMQALANAAGGCCPIGPASHMDASMPGMADAADMQMSMPSASTPECEHCHPQAHDSSCSAMHGCGTSSLPIFASLSWAGARDLNATVMAPAVPWFSRLAYEPPLRPPAA